MILNALDLFLLDALGPGPLKAVGLDPQRLDAVGLPWRHNYKALGQF